MARTQKKLEENLKTLTSPKQRKKTGKTSGTTTKKQKKVSVSAKPKPKRKSNKPEEIKFTRSRDMKLFPWVGTFPWRLEDRKEKKTAWFQCYDHAEKYIRRYNLTKLQYKLQEAAV